MDSSVSSSRRSDHAWERGLPIWHLLFFGLLALGSGLGLAEGDISAGELPIVVVVAAAMVAGYTAFFILRRPWTHSPPMVAAYLVAMSAGWAILLRQSPTYFWLQPALFSQVFFMLPARWTVILPALFGVAAVGVQFDYAASTEPFPDRLLGVAMSLGITAAVGLFGVWVGTIIEESEERHDLIEQLEETRRELAERERMAGIQAERQRLARELHDTVAQDLTAIIMQLRAAAAAERADEAEAYREAAERIAEAGLAEARRIVWALRPSTLETAGLVEALGRIVGEWRPHDGVRARLTVTGSVRPLHPELEVTLVRAVQEGLANVAQHARARSVEVVLAYLDDTVSLTLHDDGIGFEGAPDAHPSGGLGLLGMRERAEQLGGSVAIESRPGHGTTIGIHLPVPAA